MFWWQEHITFLDKWPIWCRNRWLGCVSNFILTGGTKVKWKILTDGAFLMIFLLADWKHWGILITIKHGTFFLQKKGCGSQLHSRLLFHWDASQCCCHDICSETECFKSSLRETLFTSFQAAESNPPSPISSVTRSSVHKSSSPKRYLSPKIVPRKLLYRVAQPVTAELQWPQGEIKIEIEATFSALSTQSVKR